ncbi:MAG: Gfo/Idh/MocA family oxidoreductase [Gammaproteobacteria bacterium]|nr:Gfo/Idh/MocA family oxidoreductase [Gammaproteobacteria bacterium]
MPKSSSPGRSGPTPIGIAAGARRKAANRFETVSERKTMSLDRRGFVKQGAAASLAFWAGTQAKAQSQKLRIAVIGCGGRGAGDIKGVESEHFVAFADADFNRAAGTFKKYADVPKYDDYRVMLEKHEQEIDAVVIATPDHHHAVATMMAMGMGKHVYTEKPLTRTVHEARAIREYAAAHPELVTQMGNQGTAATGLREAVEAIRAGAIGQVREAHIWSNRPVWPQGLDRPSETMEVRRGLNWDIWLGPSPARPYHKAYLPFS